VDLPGCSTNPPTPGRILHDATLTKQSHVDPKPFLRRQSRRHCHLLQAFAVSHQQCVEILSRYFLPQGQEPHGRVVTFHSRQNFGCRRRTTHVLDSSRFPKDLTGHRVSSLVCQTSDSTTLTLPVVQIAERTVMCSAARTNVVFTNSYVDNNSSLISE
jgi:hypothetical protein